MTQMSWPWSTVAAVGDGSATLSETLSRLFLATYFHVQNPAVEGVSKGVLNELACTGVATPIAVASGSGVCYGLYFNDASVNLAVTSPAVGTTGGRVVLQTNWAGVGGGSQASTRLVARKNTDGVAAIPALTQVAGTTWEISLATFTITTGGVITLTDDRTFRKPTTRAGTAEIADLAITTAKIALLNITTGLIADLAVTTAKLAANAVTFAKFVQAAAAGNSVVGRAANSAGDFAEIVAGTDGHVLRRSGTTLGFGTLVAASYAALSVGTAALALNSVDDTIAGNRVPQFYRRQGGSATDWTDATATTTQTPTAVRMQAGVVDTGGAAVVVTFPVAFSNKPLVFVAPWEDNWNPWVSGVSTTQFTVNGGGGGFGVNWLAIGPE